MMSRLAKARWLLEEAQALMYEDVPPGDNEIEAYQKITEALDLMGSAGDQMCPMCKMIWSEFPEEPTEEELRLELMEAQARSIYERSKEPPVEKPRKIRNPVTNTEYEIRKAGPKGKAQGLKGKWKRDRADEQITVAMERALCNAARGGPEEPEKGRCLVCGKKTASRYDCTPICTDCQENRPPKTPEDWIWWHQQNNTCPKTGRGHEYKGGKAGKCIRCGHPLKPHPIGFDDPRECGAIDLTKYCCCLYHMSGKQRYKGKTYCSSCGGIIRSRSDKGGT